MQSISKWLVSLDLGQYATILADNDVDLDALRLLNEKDLQELGISLGHRKKLLKAIAELNDATVAAPSPAETAPRLPTDAAERRQLTVMFCDLVGSTALSQKLDPETLRELMRSYQQSCGAVIDKYDGHVAQYLGDGLMVYFGWPRAHEDDAERAVRAGLEIVETVKQVEASEPLHVRIGIATGPVVVGETGDGDASVPKVAVGETPNLAARIQGLADSDQIIIGPDTRHLVGGTFDLGDFGEHALKGIVEPVRAWRVSGLARSEGRFEAAHGEGGLTPLVGREQELGLLMERWQLAQDGEGQVVLLSGEPGIGKSRVLSALRERLEGQGAQSLRFQCSPYYVNSAFWPSINSFERALKFGRDETPESKLDKLESLIVAHYERPFGDVRFIAAMLSIPCDDRYGAISITPQKHKDETLRTLVDLTEAAARKQPSVLLFEDLHWADPTMLEVLDLLIDRVSSIPLLIVLTHRPEFQNRWASHGHVSALILSKLTRPQSSALISRVTGGKALPDDLLVQILAKTDGVPLFVEELTKSILESGELTEAGDRYAYAGATHSVTIPVTLRDSLMARLDRYMPVKQIAQIGAAIGREFSYELLAAVSPIPQEQFDDALAQFTDSGLAFRRGTPPEATYTFKHALVQDAAYDSLLMSRRQELHGKIANVLEEHFPQTSDTEPEVLAHHYTQGNLPDPAVEYWLRAGRHAEERSAYQEAVAHLQNGLTIVEKIPEGDTRTRMEIALNLALGSALIGNRGLVEQVGSVFERARTLSEQVDSPSERFVATWGLWFFNNVRGDHDTAIDFANELMGLAGAQHETGPLLQAHHASWTTNLVLGNISAAREHSAHGREMYDIEAHKAHKMVYGGHDPGMCCRVFGGLSLWLLGYPDQASRSVDDAVQLARRLAHPMSLALALTFGNWVSIMRRDPELAGENAEEAIRVATEPGIAMLIGRGQIARGWVLATRGEPEAGIVQIHEGLVVCAQTGSRMGETYYIALLAELHLAAGQTDEAKVAIGQAKDIVEATNERWWEANIYRLEGDIILRCSPDHAAEAESCYTRALKVARAKQARSLELRAAISLARLWQSQDKRKEAHDLLAPVYNWFTEGFDTKDLKEAKALLDELGS